MRKRWMAVLGTAIVLGAVAAGPVLAADTSPSGSSNTQIAGYTLQTLSAAVRYQLNSPGLLPVGDPNEGNVMEADMPFARINVSQGPLVDALGSPVYGGDTLAHLGTALVTFGAPPNFNALNYPVLAEANYPPAPGHAQDESFGTVPQSSGGAFLGLGTAQSHAAPDSATVESHISRLAVPDTSPVVDVGASSATNKTIVKDNLITSQAVSTVKSINIAGAISIEGVTSTAVSTSDGVKGKPTATLQIGKVTAGGQAAYIDNDGVHLVSQNAVASGVTAGAEQTLQNTLKQDGISIRTISPKTTVQAGAATADAGGIAIVLERTVPALGVPGVPAVQLPGQPPVALGTPDVKLHIELLIGYARAIANATGVPVDTSLGDVGVTPPGGDVLGESQTNTDLSATGPGASVSGALTPVPSSSSATNTGTGTQQVELAASPHPPNGEPVPIAALIFGFLACIVVLGPLLGYARWQLLEGRRR
ncbi:MAG TPA: hypothetical protein VFA83_13410 [Acidimicrobiales bacterium]|nr:hypothetical protein [Acidimicrobiales bacterium]